MAPNILIVGAGPTGLTAAACLAHGGVIPTVIERRNGPSTMSRAVGISNSTVKIFETLGIADAVLRESIHFDAVIPHDGATPLGRIAANFDERSIILGLPQDRTEHHLTNAFQSNGGEILFDTPLERLTPDGAGALAQFGGRTQRFDLILGADGVNSTVRQELGIPFEGYDLPNPWAIADVDAPDWPHQTTFQLFVNPGGHPVVVAPLAPGRFRVIAEGEDALKALPAPMKVAQLRRASTFTIQIRQAERYGDGGVYLAGDAAHCHSPVGGRGMNLGISDAADWAGRALSGGLDQYEHVRKPIGAQVIRQTEAARRLIQTDNPFLRAFLMTAIRVAAAIPPIGRIAIRRALGG